MAAIAHEISRRVRIRPMHALALPHLRNEASRPTARAAALALCTAIAAAAALTMASLPRSTGEVASALVGPLPPAVTLDRRLKGDRLDRLDPRDSSLSNEPASPGNMVPKTSPAMPADPVDAPRDDPTEHGCAPTPTRNASGALGIKASRQCLARADGTRSPRYPR
jgi:hypothetical protein